MQTTNSTITSKPTPFVTLASYHLLQTNRNITRRDGTPTKELGLGRAEKAQNNKANMPGHDLNYHRTWESCIRFLFSSSYNASWVMAFWSPIYDEPLHDRRSQIGFELGSQALLMLNLGPPPPLCNENAPQLIRICDRVVSDRPSETIGEEKDAWQCHNSGAKWTLILFAWFLDDDLHLENKPTELFFMLMHLQH